MSDSRFSDVLLDEIRAKAPLIDIATEYWGEPNKGTSHKLGARWGSQGSRHVDAQSHLWHDYEDGIHADVFELVMKESGRSFPEAVEFAAERAGVSLPDRPAAVSQPRQEARSAAPAPEVPPEQEDPPAAKPEGKLVVIKGYHYTDGDGGLLYDVIRYHEQLPDGSFVLGKNGTPKKTFKQRRPDGRGGFIWNLDGIGHTLYRRQQLEIAVSEGKTILLPEGEKDVDTLVEWGLDATTNSGGAQNWKPEFAEFFRGADVVILGDDDEAGRKRVETIGLSLRGIAKRIRAIGSWGGPKDVTDWKEAGHTADELSAIIGQLPDWRPAPPTSIMGAVGLDQLHHPSLKHEFLIDGFLDRQGVAMMPGASGSGKTFLVLEMAMCIATGQPFWGMDVKPGLVLYQAGEGKQGVTKRLDAWMQDRGVAPDASIPFRMLTRRINLFADDKDTDDFIAEGKAQAAFFGVPIRMVVVDTFNKAITGANEISGQDMTKVLSRMERISVELDCCVVSPIHKSKEGNMRGHTSLKGDASNVIEVNELNIRDRNQRIIRTVVLDKNKDGEKGKPLRFVLRQVVLGDDERGKPITTCVVDKPDGDEEEYAREGKLSLNQILALKALRQAVEDHGEQAPNGIRAGSAVRTVVKNANWKERFIKTFPPLAEVAADKREAEAKRLLQHAGKVLLAGDYIGVDNELGITWLTGKDDRPKRESKPIEKPKPSPLMTKEDQDVPF
jgi:hypothetical protein